LDKCNNREKYILNSINEYALFYPNEKFIGIFGVAHVHKNGFKYYNHLKDCKNLADYLTPKNDVLLINSGYNNFRNIFFITKREFRDLSYREYRQIRKNGKPLVPYVLSKKRKKRTDFTIFVNK